MAKDGKKGTAKGFKKKGVSKKANVIPFSKKEWYDIKTPSFFTKTVMMKTLVNRTTGKKTAESGLMGRVIEMNIGDIHPTEDKNESSFMKFKLKIESVNGKDCYTRFYGMCLTTDKLSSMIRRGQSLIEGNIAVKTLDGYLLRVFSIGFTKKDPNEEKRTCYAKTSVIKKVRSVMVETIKEETEETNISQFVESLIAGSFGRKVINACYESGVCLLQNVFIKKVKVLKMPKYDPTAIEEETIEDTGMPVDEESTWIEPVPADSI